MSHYAPRETSRKILLNLSAQAAIGARMSLKTNTSEFTDATEIDNISEFLFKMRGKLIQAYEDTSSGARRSN
jgi:hypothetical protein